MPSSSPLLDQASRLLASSSAATSSWTTNSYTPLFLAFSLASLMEQEHNNFNNNTKSTSNAKPSTSRRKKRDDSSSSDDDSENDRNNGENDNSAVYRKQLEHLFYSPSIVEDGKEEKQQQYSDLVKNNLIAASTSTFIPLLPNALNQLSKIVNKSTNDSNNIQQLILQSTTAFRTLSIPTALALNAWSSSSSNSSTLTSPASCRLPPSSSWLAYLVTALQEHGGRSRFESSAKHAYKKGEIDEEYLPSSSLSLSSSGKPDKDQMNNSYLCMLVKEAITKANHNSNSNAPSSSNPLLSCVPKCRVLHSRERIPLLLSSSNSNSDRFILKADDDVRLESFAMMIVRWCNSVWRRNNNINVHAVSYDITALPASVFQLEHYDAESTAAEDEEERDTRKKKRKNEQQHANEATVGLVEFLNGTKSIHEVREELLLSGSSSSSSSKNQIDPFQKHLSSLLMSGNNSEVAHQSLIKQQQHFLSSFVGASVTQYLLALKDRHNANILLRGSDNYHDSTVIEWINIDYSFCLGRAPGGAFSVENAPFRFPDDVFSVLSSLSSSSSCDNDENDDTANRKSSNVSEAKAPSPSEVRKMSNEELNALFTPERFPFAPLFTEALLAIRRHVAELQIMISSIPEDVLRKLSCFESMSSSEQKHPHQAVIDAFSKRLFLSSSKDVMKKKTKKKKENGHDDNDGEDDNNNDIDEEDRTALEERIRHLILESIGNKGTKTYDSFQKKSNGILC